MNLRIATSFFLIVSEREMIQIAKTQLLSGYADKEGMGEWTCLAFILKRNMAFVSLLAVLLFTLPGMALEPSLFIDGHINLTQDTMSQTMTTSGQNNIYLFGVYLRVSPKFRIYLGLMSFLEPLWKK